MNVLGLKVGGHDPGAALISNNGGTTRVCAIAEERLTRVKHAPHAFPTQSIVYVLENLGIPKEDIDLIVYDTTIDEVQFTNEVESTRWVKERVGAGFTKAQFVGVGHHDAHAATAFFCSPYEESAVLVYDGSGAIFPSPQGGMVTETETFYKGKGSTLTVIHKTAHVCTPAGFPYSVGIGRLYSNLSQNYISFGPHNEGKMMGLAAYGDDSFLKAFPYERWVKRYNGELLCNNQVSYPMRGATAFIKRSGSPTRLLLDVYNGVLSRGRRLFFKATTVVTGRLGAEAVYPKIFEPIRFARPNRDAGAEKLPDAYFSSVAFAAQKIFEQYAIELGTYLKNVTESDTLCVAGGCALNIDANRNFLTKVGFKNLFVQPASSDCGIPLGCALWGMHAVLGQPRAWVMQSASLGKPYSKTEVEKAIAARKDEVEYQYVDDAPKEAARLIADGNIIGWFQGGAEYGPRALGNRSIVCDARGKDMKDVLNNRVKHRESWRPFAASILLEKMSEWFDFSTESPYMLLTGSVLPHKRKDVPSIVHVDGTCRLQSLTETQNGPYWALVKEFEACTGVPLVLNTSFNLGGDPIVETPEDALDTFLRTDMDYLVMEHAVIRKRGAKK